MSNWTFLFHGIWQSQLIFISQEHLTMDQIPFENGWLGDLENIFKDQFFNVKLHLHWPVSFHQWVTLKIFELHLIVAVTFVKYCSKSNCAFSFHNMTFKTHIHSTGPYDLENAVHSQIAIYPFMACDIGLYQGVYECSAANRFQDYGSHLGP